MTTRNPHIGSSFDDYLAEEGILEEVSTIAYARADAWRIEAKRRRKPSSPLLVKGGAATAAGKLEADKSRVHVLRSKAWKFFAHAKNYWKS